MGAGYASAFVAPVATETGRLDLGNNRG